MSMYVIIDHKNDETDILYAGKDAKSAALKFAELANENQSIELRKVSSNEELLKIYKKNDTGINKGAFIQWTINGVDQFDFPKKVDKIIGDFVFIEGSETGIPAHQATVVDQDLERVLSTIDTFLDKVTEKTNSAFDKADAFLYSAFSDLSKEKIDKTIKMAYDKAGSFREAVLKKIDKLREKLNNCSKANKNNNNE